MKDLMYVKKTLLQRFVTTDLRGTCTDEFTGTSAATPMAAGVVALLLEAK